MVMNWMTVDSFTFRTIIIKNMTTIMMIITVKLSDLKLILQKVMLVPLRDIESLSETLSVVALLASLMKSQSHYDLFEVLTTGSTQSPELTADFTVLMLTIITTVQRTEAFNEMSFLLIANSVSTSLGPFIYSSDIVTDTEVYIIQLNINENLRILPTQLWGVTGIPHLVMPDWLPASTLGIRQAHTGITTLQFNIVKYA